MRCLRPARLVAARRDYVAVFSALAWHYIGTETRVRYLLPARLVVARRDYVAALSVQVLPR